MELKKSTKRFVISTEAPNDKAFRVRTAGIDTSQFAKNPLLIYDHDMKSRLPLGNMVEVAIEDGQLSGIPAFDPSDDFAMKIYNKVENGTIRMVSAGLLPIEWIEDENGDLWLWRSQLVEVSIVPRGSNSEALAILTDTHEVVELTSEFISNQISQNMELIKLDASVVGLVGLAAGAKPEDVQAKIKEIVGLAATRETEIVQLKSEKVELSTKVQDLTTQLDSSKQEIVQLKAAETTAKVEQLLSGAVAEGRIVEGDKPKYEKLAAADFDTTKELIESMPKHEDLGRKKPGAKDTELAKLEAKSYKDLDKSGELVKLKALDIDMFKEKFKEHFGKDYQD